MLLLSSKSGEWRARHKFVQNLPKTGPFTSTKTGGAPHDDKEAEPSARVREWRHLQPPQKVSQEGAAAPGAPAPDAICAVPARIGDAS